MSERTSLRNIAVPAAALGGLLLLSGCGDSTNVELSSENIEQVVIDGFVYDDINVRNDPMVVEDTGSGTTNACAKTDAAVIFDALPGMQSDGMGNDANGQWLGLNLRDLPESIRDSRCADDKDQIVWIAKKYVAADVILATDI